MSGFDKYNFRRLARGQRWEMGIKGPHTGRVYNPNGRRGKKGAPESSNGNNTITTFCKIFALILLLEFIKNLFKTNIFLGLIVLGIIGLILYAFISGPPKDELKTDELKAEEERRKALLRASANDEINLIKSTINVEIDESWNEKQIDFAWLFNKTPQSDWSQIKFEHNNSDMCDTIENDINLSEPLVCIDDNRRRVFFTPESIVIKDEESVYFHIPFEKCILVFTKTHLTFDGMFPKDCVKKVRYPNGRNTDMDSEWTEQDWKYVCSMGQLTVKYKDICIEIIGSNIEGIKEFAHRLQIFKQKYYE